MAFFIDEAAFYERFLSDEEIVQLYNEGEGMSYPFNYQDCSLSLYLESVDGAASGIDLYCHGHDFASGDLPLFVHGHDYASGTCPLYLCGSDSAASGLPLYICGHDYASGDIPLFITGHSAATKSLNLYVGGCAHRADGYLDLFICNVGADASIPLYIRGSGQNDGYYFQDASLNLFIQRNEAATMPLYLHGPGTPSSGELPLSMLGHAGASGVINLCMGYAVGPASQTVKLYTHGF